MHVSFISLCEKKSLKKTRAILDRFAVRCGIGTWQTPITQEALDNVYKYLKRQATRQTSIACYQNNGRHQMSLLWIIGKSSYFGPHGEIEIGNKKKKRPPPENSLRIASLLAQYMGYCHDFGKASLGFQDKLKKALIPNQIQSDWIRHEWTSTALMQNQLSFKNKIDDFKNLSPEQYIQKIKKEIWIPICEQYKKDVQEKKNEHIKSVLSCLNSGLNTLEQISQAGVLTHHGFFGDNNPTKYIVNLDSSSHFQRQNKNINITNNEYNKYIESFLTFKNDPTLFPILIDSLKIYQRLSQKMETIFPKDKQTPQLFYGLFIIARASLILADHYVSSQIVDTSHQEKDDSHCCYANTKTINLAKKSEKQLNQSLDWHLTHVANQSSRAVHFFYDHMKGLPSSLVENLVQRTENKKFIWQNISLDKLEQLPQQPTLVFNMAGTGAGKTRMNIKALAVLSQQQKKPLRFAIALNLRTLTLQTYDALIQQMNIPKEYVSCLMGDYLTNVMHQSSLALNDTDEDDVNINIETDLNLDINDEYLEHPFWLEELAKKNPKLKPLIGTPLLISTADYLSNAGVPDKQGHHATALLRIANSDLILDEIDGYDPISLVSILRVIKMAGLFGRNVVVSSATLPSQIACSVAEAYEEGLKSYFALKQINQKPNFIIIDNLRTDFDLKKSFYVHSSQNFPSYYNISIQQMMNQLKKQSIFRLAQFIDMTKNVKQSGTSKISKEKALQEIFPFIYQSIQQLHTDHKWKFEFDKQKEKTSISFGLIRVANIYQCIEISKYLVSQHIHVCPYHSADLKMRRAIKEKNLDFLLNRTPVNEENSQAIKMNEDIRNRVKYDTTYKKTHEGSIFVVVATPVEEVGRDHDFDWAIIEPSSMQSIIQTSGRVNRHRQIKIEKPNIYIWTYNLKGYRNLLSNENKDKAVFIQPGFELSEKIFSEHNCLKLFSDSKTGERPIIPITIDARLRFGQFAENQNPEPLYLPKFSDFENESIAYILEQPLKIVLSQDKKNMELSFNKSFYKKYPLRDISSKKTIEIEHIDPFDDFKIYSLSFDKKECIKTEDNNIKIYDSNNKNSNSNSYYWWLCPTIKECWHLSKNKLKNNSSLGMQIEIIATQDQQLNFHPKAGCYRI